MDDFSRNFLRLCPLLVIKGRLQELHAIIPLVVSALEFSRELELAPFLMKSKSPTNPEAVAIDEVNEARVTVPHAGPPD